MPTQNLPLTNSSRRSKLTFAALAMALAGVIAPASAANFQYRHPVYGLTAPVSQAPQAQQAAAEIVVALTGGPSLPAGEVNWPYSYDLKQLLSVTGDSNWNASNVSWSLPSGTLPAGLSLGTDGVISGMPTTKNLVGSSFQVKASYKSKDGQQVYTIVVNGQKLHVTQISAGGSHTCALTTVGGVKCWGYNGYGQLGNSSTTDSLTPVNVTGLTSGVKAIDVGWGSSCALTDAGGVKCWGFNGSGELGDGTTTNKTAPVDVFGLSTGIASISVGWGPSCVVTTSGGAKCWGYNFNGQVGDGTTTNRTKPTDVAGLSSGVLQVAVPGYHSCAVTTSGAKCWGRNGNGQLGDGTLTDRTRPVSVLGLGTNVVSVTGGENHSCAITSVGALLCWGYNYYGQLGDGTKTDRTSATQVQGLTSGVARADGSRSITCAVTAAGSAKCWGTSGYGGLGSGIGVSTVPTDVSGLSSGVTSIAVGIDYACAATTTETKCWGRNHYGQLGNNSTTNSLVPADVTP